MIYHIDFLFRAFIKLTTLGKKMSTIPGTGFQTVAPRAMDALQCPVKMLNGRMLKRPPFGGELSTAAGWAGEACCSCCPAPRTADNITISKTLASPDLALFFIRLKILEEMILVLFYHLKETNYFNKTWLFKAFLGGTRPSLYINCPETKLTHLGGFYISLYI